MGNKLCAPWRKNYLDEDHHWTPRKDSHLLRLWAEIFEVQEENGEICWARVSDDVVPVNTTCIQNHPSTVFQVTAYNRHVEKIFDVKIIQPGTRIIQASECFVHWKDSKCDHEWGLNFTTPLDARRFHDCCMGPITHNCSRKAASSGSLGLSPPKKLQSRKATSNPTSPVTQPRRAISSPEEFAIQEAIEAGFMLPKRDISENSGHYSEVVATIPRVNRQPSQATLFQSTFSDNIYQMQKQQACENIYSQINLKENRSKLDGTNVQQCSSVMNQPVAEREIPYSLYLASQVRSQMSAASGNPERNTIPSENGFDYLHLSKKEADQETLCLASGNFINEGHEKSRSPFCNNELHHMEQNLNYRETYKQELRQFSREPTVLNLSQFSDIDGNAASAFLLQDTPPPKKLSKRKQENIYRQLSKETSAASRKTEGCTSNASGVVNGFDSNTLKRMLQMFPRSFPNDWQECEVKCSEKEERKAEKTDSLSSNQMLTQQGDQATKTQKSDGRSHEDESSRGRSDNRSENVSTTLGTRSDQAEETGSELNANLIKDLHSHKRSQTCQIICSTTGASEEAENIIGSGSEEGTNSDGENENALSSDVYFLPFQSQSPFASKSTATRMTGWLMIQNWLHHKMVTIVTASKRVWNRYWVCLKGTILMFYDSENDSQRHKRPKHILVISGSMVQPHSDLLANVFSLSTIFGNAYLLQSSSQAEMDGWIFSIHLACAASFARHLGRESTIKLLCNEIHKLENSIDLDLKMKKMAGVQIHMVNDATQREALERQIMTWDDNLEKLFLEQYQLRCYLAALQRTDLPSAKVVLSNMSKTTKTVLSSLNALNVTAFHALVCARMPLTVTGSFCHLNKSQDQGLLSTFRADGNTRSRPKSPRPLSLQSGNSCTNVDILLQESLNFGDQSELSTRTNCANNILLPIGMPNNQTLVVGVNDKTTVHDLLRCISRRCQLNLSIYFIRIKACDSNIYKLPDKSSLVLSEQFETIEVRSKLLFQAEIVRSKKERDFGFSIEAKSFEDSEQEEEISVFISDIGKGVMTASKKGLHVGDELVVLNGLMVNELDMVFIETLLEECQSISLTVRSSRSFDQYDEISAHLEHPGGQTDQTGCNLALSSQLWHSTQSFEKDQLDQCQSTVDQQNQTSNTCRIDNTYLLQAEDMEISDDLRNRTGSLSDTQRSCKVIKELIETERQYVRDLNCLIEWYLEPLSEEKFLSGAEIEHLFGNIREIAHFQKLFLQSLEEAVDQEDCSKTLEIDNLQFKKILFSLGSAFLYYAHHFKLYSSFCASHSKAQKILISENNVPLQEFLHSRNPKQQHSAALESYLIKPIQRILKYPLLLRQLKDLTNPHSEEHAHLREALHGMEAVAEHINEMQKIYDEYGNILDEMMRNYKTAYPHAKGVDLNVGELQMYGTVNWLNALDEIGKLKKGTELLTLLFIFKSGVVLLAQERIKGKRKPVQGRPLLYRDSTDTARFKTVIPVEHLQVRSMVGDAYECHGIWEMVQCESEKDNQPEKVFQFASSQEARRDFIRTIHHTIREAAQQMLSTSAGDAGMSQSIMQHQQSISSEQTYILSELQCSPPLNKRSNSMLNDPLVRAAHDKTVSLLKNDSSSQLLVTFPNRAGTVDTEQSSSLDKQENEVALGSQSTLASDRGGARLVRASHDPTMYSNHSAPREPVGSPIWKPRQCSKYLDKMKSPAPNEDLHSDLTVCRDQGHSVMETKQRVAFKIPPAEYRVEGTDC